ncbi:hypothetical protein OS493_022004 [Desmophyllum pertusum]|uniref:Uncharacterized protein n=1 Tax=Desmophyllum pertusum TaxID=174260 RepID=A0A9X0CQ43_9CNID|nr:hypothetical protein OS493_022004 [Desmophyllum pertusum]
MRIKKTRPRSAKSEKQTRAKSSQDGPNLGQNVENESELRELQQKRKNYRADLENAKKEVLALEKQAKNAGKESAQVEKLRAELAAKESERNTLEERLNDSRALDELKVKEQEAELLRQNEEDQAIIQDEAASRSDKGAAEGRVAERKRGARAFANADCGKRNREAAFRENQRDLQKYGVTVTAVLLAAGVTIGAVIGAITNALKATGKALGKGLKELGETTASLLPDSSAQSRVSFSKQQVRPSVFWLSIHGC